MIYLKILRHIGIFCMFLVNSVLLKYRKKRLTLTCQLSDRLNQLLHQMAERMVL